jgi:drug/metabolite transporter (DMT)-like permease
MGAADVRDAARGVSLLDARRRAEDTVMASSRRGVALSLLVLYTLRSTTYFAVRVAVGSIPPFTLGAVRFVIAGAVLYALARSRGHAPPDRRTLATCAVVGILLFVGGLGGAAIVSQRVPSGLVALAFGGVPLWVTSLDHLVPGRDRGAPSATRSQAIAVAIGLAGVGLVALRGGLAAEPGAALTLVAATASYALGTVIARRVRLGSPIMAAASYMLIGGLAFVVLALARGERVPTPVPAAALAALGHLVVLGSIVAYTAFAYLMKNASAAVSTSYAYVNPALALLVGAAFGGERLGAVDVAGVVLVCGSVFMMLSAKSTPAAADAAGLPARLRWRRPA